MAATVEQQGATRKGRIEAGYEQLAIELIQSAVSAGNEARRKSEREAELEWLRDLTNPCWLFLDVSDEVIERIIGAVYDNTYDWLD